MATVDNQGVVTMQELIASSLARLTGLFGGWENTRAWKAEGPYYPGAS